MTGVVCAIVGNSVVTAVAEVIRLKKGIIAVGNAQIDTAQSQFGGASALFDGTNDNLTITGDFSQAADFTIEFWFRTSSVAPAFQVLLMLGDESTGRRSIFLAGSVLTWNLYGGAAEDITHTGISANTWYHVAAVRSGTTVKLYLNGTASATTRTVSGTAGNANNVYIGTDSGLVSDYSGHIDEVRISNTARYTANFTAPSTAFTNDVNTQLLIHCDGTDASTYFEDDNGQRLQKGVYAIGNAQVDTAQSKFGGASYLGDGSSDSLTVTADTAFNFGTSDYTVECWIRSSSLAATRIIFDSGVATQGTRPVFYVTTDGKINIYTTATGAVSSAGSTITTNTWYHVALVRYSGTTTIYVDGVSKASTGTSYNMSSTATMWIGAESPGTTNSWNGHIDEFRVSNTARYTTGFTAPTAAFVNDANTLLLLHCDGTDGITVFEDDVGVRAPIGITALGNAQVDTAQSKFGGASALFDGTGDYLSISVNQMSTVPGTGDFTWEAWGYFNNTNADMALMEGQSTGSLFIRRRSDNKLGIGRQNIAFDAVSTSTVGNASTWIHLAVVRSGSTLKMYANGSEIYSGSNSTNYGFAGEIQIGASGGTTYMNGWLDEIRVSNSARYTAGFTPSTTPFQNDSNTLLLLHMDGTDGSTVFIDDNGVTPDHDYT